MLELRPNCECCDKDLPPDSPEGVYLLVRVYFLPGLHDGAAARSLPKLRRHPASTLRRHARVKPDELA